MTLTQFTGDTTMRAKTFKFDGWTYKMTKNEVTKKVSITCVETCEVLVYKVGSTEAALVELGIFLQEHNRV
jgi:hypothetical protein